MGLEKKGEGEPTPRPVYTHRCDLNQNKIMTPHNCIGTTNPECEGCRWIEKETYLPKIKRISQKGKICQNTKTSKVSS